MAQNQINTGNAVNDGQGAPLRTAFNDVNLNFNQIWQAGPVNSNIQIANNTIQAVNTNGNIVLATNGIGVVVPAASIVPDIPNVRMLGTATSPFNTVYSQYITANSGAYSGNLYIAGNLLVDGAQVSINQSNLNIDNAVITVSANAPYASLADGSGIIVGGAGASLTYSALTNDWVSNLPIAAPKFIGDGSGLSNISAATSATSLTGTTIASGVLYSNLQSVGTLINLTVSGNIIGNNIISNSVTTGSLIATTISGEGGNISNISGAMVNGSVGNAVYATFAGSAEVANLAALATQAVNADTALFALNTSYANVANTATFAQLANVANTACMADVANAAVVAGMAETIAVQTSITVTGNIVTGGILTDYYYYANGRPFVGGGGSNYGNANVAAYLPVYTGDMLRLGNIASFGTAFFNNVSIGGTTSVSTLSASGSVAANAVYTNNYFYANGVPFNGSSSGYVLGDQQFYGTGSPGPYTLTQSSTNNGLIVTINGLVQAPGPTYNVAGNLITFNTVINTNELVDIRYLGTTNNIGTNINPGTWSDIIPIGNNAQTLGNSTNQWATLWVDSVINGGNLSISTGGASVLTNKHWIFDTNGNITLPGNTSSINYANGTPYGGSGGAGNPSAPNHSVQFNNNGVFGGTANLTTDGTNLSSTGNIVGASIVATDGLLYNSNTITGNTVIGPGLNALSVGPLTMVNGATLLLPNGHRWIVM